MFGTCCLVYGMWCGVRCIWGLESPPPEDRHPAEVYRDTSLMRNSLPLGIYRSMCPGPYGGPRGVGAFLLVRYPCTVGPWSFEAWAHTLLGSGPRLGIHYYLQLTEVPHLL